jgi:tRNA pseudouridine55 synthase
VTARGGILVVDKPSDWTSHDVVARVRRIVGTRKVGHAGTLDPMATGVLVLGIDASTRLLTHVVGSDKEYLATIRLGASTTTDDAEGQPLGWASADRVRAITPDALAAAVAHLTGEIDQVPSSVSAIKVDGKRAYAKVRAGEQVELAARRVTVSAFEVLGTREVSVGGSLGDSSDGSVDGSVDGDHVALDVDVRVVCSSGTYVRALARDLGVALLTGGHLTALRRTRVGPFGIADARPLAELSADPALAAGAIIPPACAAAALFPVLALAPEQAIDLRHGKRPVLEAPDADIAAAIDPQGRLVALVRVRGGVAKVVLGFPAEEETA